MNKNNHTPTDETIGAELGEMPDWRRIRFWQELYLYYWVFALAGHYVEIIWARIVHIATGYPIWEPTTSLVIPLAAPYGLGAVGVILFVWPLIKDRKLHPIAVFGLNVLITTVAEYFCATMLVIFVGYNQFWDYSDRILNINGYVCLEASLLFGALATAFIYLIYPFCERIIKKINKRQLNIIFWILLASYIIDWTCSSLNII